MRQSPFIRAVTQWETTVPNPYSNPVEGTPEDLNVLVAASISHESGEFVDGQRVTPAGRIVTIESVKVEKSLIPPGQKGEVVKLLDEKVLAELATEALAEEDGQAERAHTEEGSD